MPPVGSYPTLSPITCALSERLANRPYEPSAGLLSVALDVAAGLRLHGSRRRRPSGCWPERPLLRVRTLLCVRGLPLDTATGRTAQTLLGLYLGMLGAGFEAACAASAPEDYYAGRGQPHLDPLRSDPALLPARVVSDGRVEPDARAFWLHRTLESRVFPRLVQRGAGSTAVDGVARPERLYARRASPQGAGDPLVAPALVYPAPDVVDELPERDPLIYAHTHLPPL